MTGSDTLQAFVRTLAAQGNRPALLAFHKPTIETWSFAELSNAATRLASGLLEADLRDGEPVAIYSPNRVEWIIACLALLDAGAVPVPVDSQMASDDLAHVLATVLARGHYLVWFPEGSRSLGGTLRPFQPGIGVILTAYPVPLVPVLIEGSFETLAHGGRADDGSRSDSAGRSTPPHLPDRVREPIAIDRSQPRFMIMSQDWAFIPNDTETTP